MLPKVTRRTILAAPAATAALAQQAQSPSGGWKAGVAAVRITPGESIWMAGYAARTKPSEGVQTDLHAKALALQDDSGKTAVLVTSDLIGFRREIGDEIAARCQKQFGLSRDRLLLNSSHTHSGPVIGRFTPRSGYERQREVIERYAGQLMDNVVRVAGNALEKLAPARLEFGQGLGGFAVNRRRDRAGMRHLPAPVDHDVPVLAARGPDGALRAVVFGYACHNTSLGAYQINADYAGYAQAALEKTHPGATALFVLGCGADANPLPRYHGTDPKLAHYALELAGMYGRILAAAVDLVLHGKMTPLAGPLRTAFQQADLPFQPPSGKETPRPYPCPVQVWQFGPGMKFIALGGEVVVDYALRLKAQHGWNDTWVAGYSNDVFAYVPSVRVLKEGGYETQGRDGVPFSGAVEEILIEKVSELLRTV